MKNIVCLTLLSAAFALIAHENRGTVTGVITDTSGGVLPNVAVELTKSQRIEARDRVIVLSQESQRAERIPGGWSDPVGVGIGEASKFEYCGTATPKISVAHRCCRNGCKRSSGRGIADALVREKEEQLILSVHDLGNLHRAAEAAA